MKKLVAQVLFLAALGTVSAADTPRIGVKPLPSVGPIVDVTLKSGESSKGQLVSYAEGSLTLRLDDGTVVTQDGAAVVSVRFLVESKPLAPEVFPSSQSTQLSLEENRKLFRYKGIERNNKISPEEEKEFKLLLTKLDVHIKALEREIPKVKDSFEANDKLSDLTRSNFLLGMTPEVVKSNVKIATNSIENEAIRKEASGFNASMFQRLDEERKLGFKPNRPLLGKQGEKMLEKIAPSVPPVPAPAEKSKEF